MTARDFAFWLQGLFELSDPTTLDARQTTLIKRHLNLVFKHEIDPSYSSDPVVQQTLQETHDGKPNFPFGPPPLPGGGSGLSVRC